jgi:hypothetical protein
MPRTVAELHSGRRNTDYISLGVLAKTFPSGKVQEILKGSGKGSIRERDMPAHVVIYCVIALSLYMQSSCREVLRCLLEGVQWQSRLRAERGFHRRASGWDPSH